MGSAWVTSYQVLIQQREGHRLASCDKPDALQGVETYAQHKKGCNMVHSVATITRPRCDRGGEGGRDGGVGGGDGGGQMLRTSFIFIYFKHFIHNKQFHTIYCIAF